ncbi:MAG TPA: hypothetical protein VI112_17805, partial [Bacteroidia bacterium]
MKNFTFILSATVIGSSLLAFAAGAQTSVRNTPKSKPPFISKWSKNDVFEHRLFIENKGQFDKKAGENTPVSYGVIMQGEQLYFSPNGITYRYDEYQSMDEEDREHAIEKVSAGGKKTQPKLTVHTEQVTWEGSNPGVQIIGEDKSAEYFTYGDVNDAAYSHYFKAAAWKKLLYKDLYPGIDVEYIFPQGKEGIKYTIIVHPGADATQVRMKYSGDHKPKLSAKGNIEVEHYLDKIIDHAPVAFYQGNEGDVMPSKFLLKDNTVSFITGSYDHSQTLIIDPWTTVPTFNTYNAAYDVEYDFAGNTYIYGGTYPWQEIKLDVNGVIQWTYSANLFYSSGCFGACYGDFAVDGTSGSSYLVEGFNGGGGTRVIKVDNSGAQVTVFPGNNNFGEMWRIVFNNCTHKSVIAGGGTQATYQACVLDTTLVNMTPVNVLNANTALHDFALLSMDNANNVYLATARSQAYPNQFDNVLLQVPGATLSPTNYMVSDNHTFIEVASINYVNNVTAAANGFNGMAVSPNFVYTYDGATLKKWNKSNGTLVGSVSVTNTMFTWGGLDVDDCDDVFIGVQSTVKQ